MAQIIVRNIEESVKLQLRRRAARHGRSMEEEARAILRNALKGEATKTVALGSRLAARFAGRGLQTDIAEQRGSSPRPARFER